MASSGVTASNMGETNRMAGLMSGLDTESLIKASTANTKIAINNKKKKMQTLTWKQEGYRDVISKLSDFQSKYLDILSSSSIKSNSNMNKYKAESSNDKLGVYASSASGNSEFKVSYANQATSAKVEGTAVSAQSIDLNFSYAQESNTVDVTLDGTTKSITFAGGLHAKDNFLEAVNNAFKKADGTGATFKFDGDSINAGSLTVENGSGDREGTMHTFAVGAGQSVGLSNTTTSQLKSSATLDSVKFKEELKGDSFSFNINGVDFSFNKSAKISDITNAINKSNAGVKLSFSGLTQGFTLETTGTGASSSISMYQTKGNLLNALFNKTSDELYTPADSVDTKTVNNSAYLGGNADSVIGTYNSDNAMSFEYTAANGTTSTITVPGTADESGHYNVTVNDLLENVKDSSGNSIFSFDNGKLSLNSGSLKGTSDAANALLSKFADTVTDSDGNVTAKSSFTETSLKNHPTSLTVGKDISDPNSVELPGKNGTAPSELKFKFHTDNSDGTTTATQLTLGSEGGDALTLGDMLSVKVDTDDSSGNKENIFSYDAESGELSLKEGMITVDKNDTESVAFFSQFKNTTTDANGNLVVFSAEEAARQLSGTVDLAKSNAFVVSGTNATVTINDVTLESASNAFTIDGTTFDISKLGSFDASEEGQEEIVVKTSHDTSSVKETIVNFINDYNTLMKDMHELLSTTRPKSEGSYYDPLTEEEEDEMDEDEIEKWNEKAKTGLLYQDQTVTRALNNIKISMMSSVNGMWLRDLGITLDTSKDTGEMQIDESKLESAIGKWGDDIATFFTDSEKGLAYKVSEAFDKAISTKKDNSGYPQGMLSRLAGVKNTTSETKNQMYAQMNSLQKMIDSLNNRYKNQQSLLWQRYTRLESYIGKMSAQSSVFGTY